MRNGPQIKKKCTVKRKTLIKTFGNYTQFENNQKRTVLLLYLSSQRLNLTVVTKKNNNFTSMLME